MAYEPVCPALVMLPIERVLIGEVIYGFETNGNYARKGWTLLPNPFTVNGRGLVDKGEAWELNSYVCLKRYCRYVLIRAPRAADHG